MLLAIAPVLATLGFILAYKSPGRRKPSPIEGAIVDSQRISSAVEIVPGKFADISFAGTKRVSDKAWVSPGLTEDELRSAMSQAVRALRQEHGAAAASMHFYVEGQHPDDMGTYSAGMAEDAPFGDWGRASEDRGHEVAVTVASYYFGRIDPGSFTYFCAEVEDPLFHASFCGLAKGFDNDVRAWKVYSSYAEAVDAGHVGCSRCNPIAPVSVQ